MIIIIKKILTKILLIIIKWYKILLNVKLIYWKQLNESILRYYRRFQNLFLVVQNNNNHGELINNLVQWCKNIVFKFNLVDTELEIGMYLYIIQGISKNMCHRLGGDSLAKNKTWVRRCLIWKIQGVFNFFNFF